MSIAKESLRMTGLFEAEVLVELMLRHWKHLLATDRDFCARKFLNLLHRHFAPPPKASSC